MKKDTKLATLKSLFQRRRVVDMSSLCSALETTSRITVFRYLRQLKYLTSYTHSRTYYTLLEIAQFDQDGLWHCGDIGFSAHGTLLNTLVHLITQSEAGKTNSELEEKFQIRVQNSLHKLLNINKISGEKLRGKARLYVSTEPEKRQKQIKKRVEQCKKTPVSDWTAIEVLVETVRASSSLISVEVITNCLHKRRSSITRDQVEQVFDKYGLEKKRRIARRPIFKDPLRSNANPNWLIFPLPQTPNY
jgi:hypothetical protein